LFLNRKLQRRKRLKFKLPEIPPPKLISTLRSYNLLPAIVFLPTRRKCDEAATEVALDKSQKIDAEKQERRREIFQDFLIEFPEIKSHKHRKILLNGGIAAHHAGHIPAWKLLIEKMMSSGLLNAIFATSTVAAGVDFPARTVVVSNADTRGNDGWRALQASELQQMTGRAGRRGKDNVGFVVLAPSNFQNPPKIAQLLKSPPDALESKFRATYTSFLNLLDAFGSFAQVREIAEKSFAFRDTARTVSKLEKQSEKRLRNLREKLEKSEFDYTIEDVRGFERLTNARLRLEATPRNSRGEMRRKWLEENVEAGRVVTKSRNGKRFYLVINVHGDKITAMRDDGQGATLSLTHLGRVFEKKYPLKEEAIEAAFYEIHEGKNPPLDEPKLSLNKDGSDDALTIINSLIEKFLPENSSEDQKRSATSFLWNAWEDAEFLEKTARDVDYLKSEIWLPFEHRARVLHHFGYLDFPSQKVTTRGKWLADLRVDRPLLVGEALRHGLFEKLAPKQVAGLMAALAADSDRNYGELYLSDEILEILTKFEDIIFDVSNVEWKNGVEPSPDMNFSAAAAAERWADGMDWSDLVFRTKAEEGDLVRLLSRTGEALMQIAHLKDSNPKAAEIARTTAETILREPIR
jgi:ATP-dependent RNA helicase HelY